MSEENLVDIVKGIVKKVTDLTLENMILRKKLEIAVDKLRFISNTTTGIEYDRLSMTVDVARNALIEIEKADKLE